MSNAKHRVPADKAIPSAHAMCARKGRNDHESIACCMNTLGAGVAPTIGASWRKRCGIRPRSRGNKNFNALSFSAQNMAKLGVISRQDADGDQLREGTVLGVAASYWLARLPLVGAVRPMPMFSPESADTSASKTVRQLCHRQRVLLSD
jgi:hypothetical protein